MFQQNKILIIITNTKRKKHPFFENTQLYYNMVLLKIIIINK